MARTRVRFELRVATVVGPAALATFRVPVSPTAVPRRTVYRLRVPADRDLPEVVHRLTARDVEVLEIRRCDDVPPRRPAPARHEPQGDPGTGGARVVPLRRAGPPRPDPRPAG
ncbi:hypothetical protein [Geodermatophilus sp. SYSU D00815]